ncbi:hypothetical protein BDZ45DRAFT_750427 [Acephala macrosclerotiorum]|nr:hypothetical protein BDZ45DRAFT_750427 [Acephala macrosclerotiorum]
MSSNTPSDKNPSPAQPQSSSQSKTPNHPPPPSTSSTNLPTRLANLKLNTSVLPAPRTPSVVLSPTSPSVPWPLHISWFRKMFGLPKTYKYQSYLEELEDGKWAVFEDEVKGRGTDEEMGDEQMGARGEVKD